MSAAPRVSVITIFLDAERFVEEAIESVFAQSYPDWELLLVDDGSTDRSTAIGRSYAAAYPERVRYFEHPEHANRGMSASRNLGLRHARGELVAFLDADDLFLPEKLERQVALLDAHRQAAMVYGASLHWHSWTGRLIDRLRDRKRNLGVAADTLVPPPRLVSHYLGRTAHTPGTCAVLVRRAAAEAIGGFEERFTGMFEDQAFFYKIALAYPVFVESGSWDRYRQTPHSHSRVMRRAGVYRVDAPNAAYRDFLTWLESYLGDNDIADRHVWAELRRELRPYGSRTAYASALARAPLGRLKRLLRARR
jgi:glycosyltransferase involved in cell wall biosynthesis